MRNSFSMRRSMIFVGRLLSVISVLLVACEKNTNLSKLNDAGGIDQNLFDVAPSEIAGLTASHFELTAFIAGQRRNVEAAKNARESTINEAPLFTNVNEVVKIDTLDDTDGSELLFVVNFRSKSNTDKKGFVVMSADKRTIPVLAWSEEGPMELGAEMPEPVTIWLEYAKEVVRRGKMLQEPSREAFVSWKRLEEYLARKTGRTADCPHPNPQICSPCNPDWNILVGPVTTPNSLWGQSYGFNNAMWARGCGDCGKAATGCAAVALGIIMRFDHKPSVGYNFGIMPQTIPVNQCAGFSVGQLEVAKLLYNLSAIMNSGNAPSACATYTLPGSIVNGFAWAGYSQTGASSSNIGLMENETQFGRPVLMSGTKAGMDLNDPHYWVCDGYNSTNYCYSNTGLPEDCYCIINTYHHINWGWRAKDIGWFTLGNLNPGGSGKYDSWLRVRLGVKP